MLDRAPRRISPSRLGARRAWVAFIALSAGACSIYSSELVDNSASNVGNGAQGGGNTSGASTGGKSSSTGGKATGNSTSTPEGGDDGTGEGGAGATPTTPDGGTSSAGTAGTATGGGTAGTTGGGGMASGGTAGSGGGPVGSVDLIDDFEDKNITIEPNSGRSGVWYTFGDGTTGGATVPDPLVTTALSDVPEALIETLGGNGLHVTATGWTSTGSGIGFDFRAGKKVYDASKFSGVRFWAKVAAGKNTKHRVQITDVTTDSAGGKCKDTANATKCGNHFGAPVKLTTAWAQYTVWFANLTQIDGWGNTADAIDLTQVYGFQITAGASLDVDIWLDQFEFIVAE